MAIIPNTGTSVLNQEVRVFQFAGSPTDGTSGTYAGIIQPGGLLVDVTNANLYINTNTQDSPTYKLFTHA